MIAWGIEPLSINFKSIISTHWASWDVSRPEYFIWRYATVVRGVLFLGDLKLYASKNWIINAYRFKYN